MHLIDIPVTAWLPIRTAIWKDRIEACADSMSRFIESIPQLAERVGSGISKVKASAASPPKSVFSRLAKTNIMVHARQTEFVRVTAICTLDRDKFNEDNPDHELDEDFAAAWAALNLASAMEALLVLTGLAEPGRVDANEGTALASPGGYARIRASPSFFQLWFPDSTDPTWPALATIPLAAVVEWSSKTSFLKGAFATTKVERMLAAYTQMVQLAPHREGETLFRAMQALEAFYCDGIGDLRKQLAEKSAIWLGPWSERKNIVGHLYDMRSKFVHGSSKLQYSIDHADPWDEDEKHMSEFYYSVALATRLVVATLQKCISDEVHNIEWSYSVKASRAGA
ncbi:hypothetical protein [Lysobacter sp. D1-1-M9]|uniref:hypothetical protein n=1 Tax=Novilysobacter longmucuonensis TaxID=3098603 RepID=UPI002FC5B1CF